MTHDKTCTPSRLEMTNTLWKWYTPTKLSMERWNQTGANAMAGIYFHGRLETATSGSQRWPWSVCCRLSLSNAWSVCCSDGVELLGVGISWQFSYQLLSKKIQLGFQFFSLFPHRGDLQVVMGMFVSVPVFVGRAQNLDHIWSYLIASQLLPEPVKSVKSPHKNGLL